MPAAADYISTVPMRRWLLASKRLQLSTEEIMESSLASSIVAACEKAGQEEGGNFDQYDRFLDCNLTELSEYLTDGEAEAEGADKSEG